MPPVHVSFAHQMLYGQPGAGGVRSGVGTRPYVWFEIINPATGRRSNRAFGLIDSGCDLCFLDAGLLAGLGLTSQASKVVVAGGGTVNTLAAIADIEIEGVRLCGVTLTFGTGSGSLIGRRLYLGAFELAFRGGDWLRA